VRVHPVALLVRADPDYDRHAGEKLDIDINPLPGTLAE